MNPNTFLLASALFSLLVGFVLLWVSMRGDRSYFGILNPMSWLLIALFPVFLIFAFFPDSSASGSILGIKIGGALAAFMLIWMMGMKKTKEAYESELSAQLRESNQEIQKLQTQLRDSGALSVPKRIKLFQTYLYTLKAAPGKKIGLVTGNIENVKCADIWVSSENTNMEMARHYDRSVSASIRYLGAEKNLAREVTKDLVAKELDAVLRAGGVKGGVKEDDEVRHVAPGTVVVTATGELGTTHNVRKIFHVAAVHGDPNGAGYLQVPQIEICVTRALEKAKELNDPQNKSILFPLLGTGTGKGNLKDTVEALIPAAVSYLENDQKISIETVYFLTWSDVDLAACQAVFNSMGDRVTPQKL